MKKFPTAATCIVPDYPYGRLRTQATFGTEFKPGKGFRTTFQTINPKNGRVNKVKTSTYYALAVMQQDEDTGYVNHICKYDFNGKENMLRGLELLKAHFDLFTVAEIQHFYLHIAGMLKVDATASIVYCGADKDKTLELFRPSIEAAVRGLKAAGDGVIDRASLDLINVDYAAVEALHIPEHKPFKTVSHHDMGDRTEPAADEHEDYVAPEDEEFLDSEFITSEDDDRIR